MAFIIINGSTYPIRPGSYRATPQIAGNQDRMIDASLLTERRAVKYDRNMETAPLAVASARTLRDLLVSTSSSELSFTCSGDVMEGSVTCGGQLIEYRDVEEPGHNYAIVSFTLKDV